MLDRYTLLSKFLLFIVLENKVVVTFPVLSFHSIDIMEKNKYRLRKFNTYFIHFLLFNK